MILNKDLASNGSEFYCTNRLNFYSINYFAGYFQQLYIKILNSKGNAEILRSKREFDVNSMLFFQLIAAFHHWSFDSAPQQVSYMSDKDLGF
jgi:hypothetical protein